MATLVKTGRIDGIVAELAQATDWKMGLYTNSVSISTDTVWADITQATYSGFAEQNISASGSPAIDGTGKAAVALSPVTFTHSGSSVANTIKGWYVRNTVTGRLRWIEALAADRTMGAAGDVITIDGTLKFSTL